MKKTVWILLFALHFTLSAFSAAEADVPKYISFQGELTDSQGTRITTSKSVTFKLHSAASGGAILWSEVQTLTPANGIVSASIGSATAGGVSLAFDTGYWLGVTVSPDAEMSPRIRLTTSPYAFIAKFLDTGAQAYGALSVAETVTAGKFVGNGAGLTGVTASNAAPDTDWNMIGGTSGDLYRLFGNIGIGTSSPTDSLHIIGPVRVMQSNASGTFVINTGGNVGVGTASPSYLLHVYKALPGNNIMGIMVEGATSGGTYPEPQVRLKNPGGEWIWYVDDSTGNDIGAGNIGLFEATTGSQGTRLMIKAQGTVGIGTIAPSDSLHVAGRIQMDTNAAASAADGAIRWSGSDFEGRKAGAWTSLTGVGAGGDITGVTAGAGLSGGAASGNATVTVDTAYAHRWAARQTFDSATKFSDSVIVSDTVLVVNKQSGNIGIGTASPGAKLSFGTLAGSPAIHLYDGGGANQWGIGVQSLEVQHFIASNGHLSFNAGGGLQTSGVTELMRIGGDGKVGIGTTAPGDSLHVKGGIIADTLTVGDTFLVVKKSGNVGIGTASPASLLELNHATRPAIRFSNVGATVPGAENVDANGDKLVLWNQSDFKSAIGVASYQTWIQSSGSPSASIGFYTDNAAGGAPAEKMRIDASGNVGIGTTTPGDSLHVAGRIQLDTDGAASAAKARSAGAGRILRDAKAARG